MSDLQPRPRPEPSATSQPFWDATLNGEFRIQHCTECGAHVFYPRVNCTECGSQALEWVVACGRGTVYSYTVARRPTHPAFAERVPYVIAIVELDEGPRVTTNLVDCDPDTVRIGLPVELTFEAPVDGIALPLFRPRST